MSKLRDLHDKLILHGYSWVCTELLEAIEAAEAAAKPIEVPQEVREAFGKIVSAAERHRAQCLDSLDVRVLREWFDANFHEPLPQWELDARDVEAFASTLLPGDSKDGLLTIAARIRRPLSCDEARRSRDREGMAK